MSYLQTSEGLESTVSPWRSLIWLWVGNPVIVPEATGPVRPGGTPHRNSRSVEWRFATLWEFPVGPLVDPVL